MRGNLARYTRKITVIKGSSYSFRYFPGFITTCLPRRAAWSLNIVCKQNYATSFLLKESRRSLQPFKQLQSEAPVSASTLERGFPFNLALISHQRILRVMNSYKALSQKSIQAMYNLKKDKAIAPRNPHHSELTSLMHPS